MGAFDDLIPNNSASAGGAFEDLIPGNKKKKKEDQEQGRTVADVVGDIGVTALKGAVGLNQSITGLADLVSGGRAGKALEDLGFDQKQAQDLLAKAYSEPQQRANQKVSQADGFLDTLLTALDNPSTIATTVGESLPLMLGGAGVARGIMGATTKVPAWLAGAVGEGVVGAGSAAEGIRTETADGLLSPEQALAAGASGVGTAAFGAVGGKVAQKLGIGDVDTMLAQGAANAAKSDKNFVRQILEAGISESVFEEMPQSAQEQMWQNYALGKPIMEGVGGATAMGGLAGFAMGGVGGGFNAAMGGKQSNDIDTLLAELQRQAEQASAADTANPDNATPEAKPTTIATANPSAAPQASQAPVQSPATQAQDLDPELRLAELELIAGQRTLNPQETEEWQTLNAQLDAMDEQAPQDEVQEQTQIESPSSPQATVNPADAPQVPSQSPEAVPTTPEPVLSEQPSAPPPLPENQTNQGQLPSNVDGNLQNRDRARLASVRQMAEIAKNPDYLRLGPSRTPDSGAPMVFPVQDDLTNIPTENIGASDLAVMADGQQVPFNYAVVEAGTVQPSNFADGRANPDFNSDVAGTVKALNNGRTAGIRAAYEQGTADQYRAGLSQEAERLGLNPQ